MKVTVRLYGGLRRHRPPEVEGAAHQPFDTTVSAGETVAGLSVQLGIPGDRVHAVAVNGEHAGSDTVLRDGDTIHFFPPAAGGWSASG